MKWDVSYTRQTSNESVWYSQDNELNLNNLYVDASSEEEALLLVKQNIAELMRSNALGVEEDNNGVSVFEASDHEFIERYFNFLVKRVYTLLNEDGVAYLSRVPGTIGGYRRKKIYGRLDCPSALRHISNGEYVKHRVFFSDEDTAIAAGYRPCAVCMREKYLKWKANQESFKP